MNWMTRLCDVITNSHVVEENRHQNNVNRKGTSTPSKFFNACLHTIIKFKLSVFYRFFGNFDWSVGKIKSFLHFDKNPCV